MVPMVMTPNDTVNSASIDIDTMFLENSGNVFFDFDTPFQVDPLLILRQDLPVFAYAQIEENWLMRRVLNQKREARRFESWYACIVWL